jgi:hypothetical protein
VVAPLSFPWARLCQFRRNYGTAPMWGAGAGVGAGEPDTGIREIRYGEMPAGYECLMKQADTALTLTPGCYTAHISGNGSR